MHRKIGVVAAATTLGAVVLTALVAATSAFSASSTQSCPKPPDMPDTFASQVDNPYFPLIPGTVLTYKGKLDGTSSTDVFTVTHDTKMILGVTTTVVHDQVFQQGDLVEDTFDWYAQDATGNVWYFGEDTKELDHGQVVSTEGSWEAGVNNASAGIFMPAAPTVGQVFKQEDAKKVAEDCSKIVDLNASVKDAVRHVERRAQNRGVLPAGAGRPRQQVLRPGHWPRGRANRPGRDRLPRARLREYGVAAFWSRLRG